jgi:predicted PurR-regulated permease PerM
MKGLPRFWLIIASLTVLLLLTYVFRTLLTYLVVAVVIGFMGDPVMTALRRLRIRKWQMPRGLCAVFTLFLFVAVGAGILALFLPLISEEVAFIANVDIHSVTELMAVRMGAFSEWVDGLGLEFTSGDLYNTVFQQLKDAVTLEGISGAASSVFVWFGGLLAGFFAVLFMSFFFLKDGSLFYKMVFTVTPSRHIEPVKNVLSHSHRMLTKYFTGLFFQVILMTAMISLGLFALGIRNAFLIGVLAGLANVVPYFGPLIACLFGLLVGVTSGLALDQDFSIAGLLLRVCAVFGIAQFIDNWIVQPFILGPSVSVHPLELFIVLIAASTVGGVIGMAVALPVYTILRLVAREFFREYKVVQSLTRELRDQ